jgi:hypothetical protein
LDPGRGDEAQDGENVRSMLSSFNHRCRNSLNGIKMGLYLFKRQTTGPMHQCWPELVQTYDEIERLFDQLQVIYRPMVLSTVRSRLGLLVGERSRAWSSLFGGKGQTLTIIPPETDDPGDFDPMYLGLGLDAFIAWRARAVRPTPRSSLSWRIANDHFEVRWDEGHVSAGTPCRKAELTSAPGQPQSTRVDSLAWPLLARVVAAHEGTVETTHELAFKAMLCWPRFRLGQPAG